MPDSIVVSSSVFDDTIVPAFQVATATRGNQLKSFPVLEVDALVERARLRSDPARALEQTQATARAIRRVAPGQDLLIDNISNTLQVARDDAEVGKRMFLFLGLPGVLLAAFLAAYAGSILASAQRREQATLRIRGAHRGHLRRILAYRTLALAGTGSILGAVLGLATVAVVLGADTLFSASPGDLVVSGLVGVAVGVVVTAFALYVPGRRSLDREVTQERREITAAATPLWQRWGLDFVLLAVALIAEIVAVQSGAFDAPITSVAEGEVVSLPSYLLLAPMIAWIAGVLLAVRVSQGLVARLRVPNPRFGPLVGGVMRRSLRRRPRALATGIAGVALVGAFGVSIILFAATYDEAKAADARFTVGADLRITPSVLSPRPHPQRYADRLGVPGVSRVTPVVLGARQLGAHRPPRPGSPDADRDRSDQLRTSRSTGGRLLRRANGIERDGRAARRSRGSARRHPGRRRARRGAWRRGAGPPRRVARSSRCSRPCTSSGSSSASRDSPRARTSSRTSTSTSGRPA